MLRSIVFILIGLFLLNTSSQVQASEADPCPTLDFRERFGPLKNQGFHQICWAMAGSSLIEEEACLMDPKYCGVNFSAVDLTSCNPRVGHSHEENVVDRALNCAQSQGVCPNRLAPFVDFRMQQSLLGKLTMSPRFQRSQIFKLFDEYKHVIRGKSQAKNSAAQLQLLQANFVNEVRRTFPQNDFTDLQLVEILKKSKDTVELIDSTLISNACKKKPGPIPWNRFCFYAHFPCTEPTHIGLLHPRGSTEVQFAAFGSIEGSGGTL